MKRTMWLLAQLFEIILVVAGLNILWAVLRAPFLWWQRRTVATSEPEDLVALQRAANEEYTRRVIRSLPDPATAAQRLGLTL